MLSRTKIILVLILSYNWSRLNGVLAILTFVDHSLSLIISFLDHQPLLVVATTNTCSLNSASSLTLACLLEIGHLAQNTILEFKNSAIQAVSCTSYYEIRRRRFFFLQVISRKKEEKSSTDELPPRGVKDLPLSFFCPTSCWIQESKGFFLLTSYIQGQVQESQGSRWVRQGWSIATKRGREKVKKRKEKKKTKVGEKVAPAKARFRVP